MVLVTGDTHGDIDWGKLSIKSFPFQKELTKEDYLIILGDFGGVWRGENKDRYVLDWYARKSFTTLFLPGNHENYDLLKTYPQVEKFGGLVREIRDSVFMLERGYFFDIPDSDANSSISIFALGGAVSYDKEYRKEGISWWKDEVPSEEEKEGIRRRIRERRSESVDFILTHCAPTSFLGSLSPVFERDEMTDFLEEGVMGRIEYTEWVFGHYHLDKALPDGARCLYNGIYLL